MAADLEHYTRDYWLLSLQQRKRLPVDKLSHEDMRAMALNHRTAQDLFDHIAFMPARLANRCMEEMNHWQVMVYVKQEDGR
jgi:hypothetical protein